VLQVFRYNAVRIGKRRLGKLERNAVLQMVLTIFPLIPFEASARHDNTADAKDTYKNMGLLPIEWVISHDFRSAQACK
jgi:hypothetical protein